MIPPLTRADPADILRTTRRQWVADADSYYQFSLRSQGSWARPRWPWSLIQYAQCLAWHHGEDAAYARLSELCERRAA